MTLPSKNGSPTKSQLELVARLHGQKISIPDVSRFYVPWTVRKHSDISKLRDYLKQWISTYVPTKQQQNKQLKVDAASCAGHFWTGIPEERFIIVGSFMAWAFFWDDEIDCGSLTRDHEGRTDAYCDNAIAFIRSCMQPEWNIIPPVLGQLHNSACFIDIGQAMQVGQSTTNRDCFVEALVGFINSVRDSHTNSVVGTVSFVEKYIERRAKSVGVAPVVHTFTWAYGLMLPPRIWEYDATQCIIREASISVALCNDTVSLKKELADGEIDNIISLLVYNEDLSAQEAADIIIDMIQQSYQRFRTAIKQLRFATHKEDPSIQRDVNTWIDACMDILVGNIAWSLHTPRYIDRTAFNGETGGTFEILL